MIERLLELKEKKSVAASVIFTILLILIMVMIIVNRDAITKDVMHGGNDENIEIAEYQYTPYLLDGDGRLEQVFRPSTNGLATIGIKITNEYLGLTFGDVRFSIFDRYGACLLQEDVPADFIPDAGYYMLPVDVDLKAWTPYYLVVEYHGAESQFFFKGILGNEDLKESGTLTFNGDVLQGELDLLYQYLGCSYPKVALMLLVCFIGICISWTRNSFFRKRTMNGFAMLFFASLLWVWMIEVLSHNDLFSMRPAAIFVNWVLIAALFFVPMALINRSFAVGLTASSLLYGFGLVNYYTLKFRGTVLLPADILYSGKTALRVAGNYDFSPDFWVIFTTMLFVVLLLGLYKTDSQSGVYGRIGMILVAALLMICVSKTTFDMKTVSQLKVNPNLWDQTGTSKNIGFLQNMLTNIQYLKIKEPEGYSSKAVAEIYERNDMVEDLSDTENADPNIIIIMAEAMSDLSNVGEIETTVDPLENLHRLAQEGKGGYCVVPVFGGETSCSEFEFLTGCSMWFLGGIAPYQQYIYEETSGLISSMAEKEIYDCFAVHSYGGNNWGRNAAYPLLGFDQFISCEDDRFLNPEMSRAWIKDKVMMDIVKDLCDESDRSVAFGVTMECHGGYEWEGFESNVFITNTTQQHTDAEQYLSCLRSTDEAIGSMIEEIRHSDEPTIVVVFGDHLPTLSDSFYTELQEMNKDSTVEHQKLCLFETPYLLWSNYDVDFSAVPELISTNFLYPYLLQAAGMDLDPFESYLYNLSQKYPVISQNGIINAEGELCEYAPEADCYEAINEYKIVQYHRLRGE